MEIFQCIYVILLTLRPPLTVQLSATAEGHTGGTTRVSSSDLLNMHLVKPNIKDKESPISSLPSSQLEFGHGKYPATPQPHYEYTANQSWRNIACLSRCGYRDMNFSVVRSSTSTFHGPHKSPQFALPVQENHVISSSKLITSLVRMLNRPSRTDPNQMVNLPLSSTDSPLVTFGNHQLNPKPKMSQQYFTNSNKLEKIQATQNTTEFSGHKNEPDKSSISNRLIRHKREVTDRNQEARNKQFDVNGDNTRIDFVEMNSDSPGYDELSTPRPTLGFELQIPTDNYAVEKRQGDKYGFTDNHSEMLQRRMKTLRSVSPAIKQPGTFQTSEEDHSISLDSPSSNFSRQLTSFAPVSRKWCQEEFTPYVARLYKLDCTGEEFKDGSPDTKYFIPDVDTIKLTSANFKRLLEVVNQSNSARVSTLYLGDSNVDDVTEVFNLFDSRFILSLNLSNNSVTRLTGSIFSQAAQLEYLDLSHNFIHEVDATIFQGATKLKYLFLRNNLLSQLPGHVFRGNGHLQELHLDHNRITTISSQALDGLTELMSLYLDNNNLGDELNQRPGLFTSCPYLQTLLLSHCQIGSLSKEALLGLTSLRHLGLSWNLLTHIAPGTFSELHVLNHLNLDHNKLRVVSPTWNLPSSLKILSLAGNQITDVEDGVFDGIDLTVMFLNSNKLQVLSPTIQMYLSSRINVTLADNSWHCDCNLVYLIHLVNSRLHSPYDDVNCASPRRMRMSAISIPEITCPVDKACADAVCTPCTRGLQRKVGSRCVCMEGTQASSGLMGRMGCSACPPDHYKPAAGDNSCVPCSTGSIPVSGPSPVCACAVGYYTNKRGDCEKCQPGTYKMYAGVGSCSACTSRSTHPQQCSQAPPDPGQNITFTRAVDDPDVMWPSVTAAVGVLVLITVIIISILVRHYHSKQKLVARYTSKTSIRSTSLHVMDTEAQNSHGSNSNSIEFRCNGRDCIRIKSIGNMIGRGAFGQVFEGYVYLTSHDKEPVKIAIKRLKDSASDEEVKSMKDELDQMLNVGPHPNIIGLYGSVFYDGQLCIVMEYAELGDLLTYLRTECASPLQYVRVGSNGLVVEQSAPRVEDNAVLMMFAWQIAKGMSHLEIHRFIHRDLAARNCLLTRGPIAKVSDFGLSKDAYELGHYRRVQKDRVPFKWLSPEALLWGQYSSKSDVWAFGILLYELYTFGGTPYPQVTTEQLRELHENGYRMSKPPACPEQMYRIMRACWREDPRQRPSFKQLVLTLDLLIQKTNNREYLELHAHGLKSSNPLPVSREDMDDQKTSLEFVYRNKTRCSYQSRQSYCEPPYDNMTIAINLLNRHDHILYNDTCLLPAGLTDNSSDVISSDSTATSGFQSMSSAQTS